PIVRKALEPVLWGIGSREWGIGSRESGIGSRKSGIGNGGEHDQLVPRSQGVAARDVTGQGILPADTHLPEGRIVRRDQPDPASSGINSGEHRGGQRPGEHGRIHPFSARVPGKPQGTGDPSHPGPGSGDLPVASGSSASRTGGPTRPDAPGTDSHAPGETPTGGVEGREWGGGSRGLAGGPTRD